MVLFIEVRSGPLNGRRFRANPGLMIGRREGEILLESDGKVSGLHGKIELDNKGQMILVDQESANAFVINGRRVKRVALLPGVAFRVGDTEMIAVELSEFEAEAAAPRKTWKDHLRDELAKMPATNREIEHSAVTFTPPLELAVMQGLQSDEVFVLGYGPRIAGRGHLDIELLEPEAPEVAFEIHPSAGAAILRDCTEGKLLVNRKRPVQDQLLHDGDQIALGGTLIRVRYL